MGSRTAALLLMVHAAACSTSSVGPHGYVLGDTPPPPAGIDAGALDSGGFSDAGKDTSTPPPHAAPTDASAIDATNQDDASTDQILFDGVLDDTWKMSTITNQPGRDDPGHFTVQDGALVAYPGTDLGLLWRKVPTPDNYILWVDFRLSSLDDNSGVFVRFPDLDSKGYNNTAWVAINFGFEIQIDERGMPDGALDHTTGAVYGMPDQTMTRVPANPPGQWNQFEIRVEQQTYSVRLNGQNVTRYVNPDATRGIASGAFIGLQTHTGNVAFRNIRMRPLP